MFKLKAFAAIALFGVVAPSAFATTGTTPINAEPSFKTHPMPASSLTRAQVKEQLAIWRQNPVSADGWRDVGGEIGWVLEPHRYVFKNGSFQHAEVMRHDASKTSTVVTEQQKEAYRSTY